MNDPLRQTQHYSPQAIEVAGQLVHRVANTLSPSRTKLCMASIWGRFASLPEALSVKVLSQRHPLRAGESHSGLTN